jgi:hypothetical protein
MEEGTVSVSGEDIQGVPSTASEHPNKRKTRINNRARYFTKDPYFVLLQNFQGSVNACVASSIPPKMYDLILVSDTNDPAGHKFRNLQII